MSTVFRVILEGEQEVPPRDTTASGVGTVVFDSAAVAASYSLDIEVEDGGLMSFGPDLGESYRRAAALADAILKGARPADLPVEEPTRFTLAVNLKTAAALAISVPPAILTRADKVIE